MDTEHAEFPISLHFQNLTRAEHPATGTQDDDDEHASENEAAVREIDENTEAPEEFEVDDQDELGHREDDDADEGDKEGEK